MKLKVVIDNQTYEVNVEDINKRPIIAVVEGERYEVWAEEGQPLSAGVAPAPAVSVPEPMPSAPTAVPVGKGSSGKDVTAPLPGVIVAVLVKPGDTVSRGQELCTLEAMKMKNAIRSSREGTIADIAVNVGDQVSHGQVLMTYSE